MARDLDARFSSFVKSKNFKKTIKNSKGETYEEFVKKEAAILTNILKKHIRSYYSSYTPKVHKRKKRMLKGFHVVYKSGSMVITFKDDVYQPSIMKKYASSELRFTPTLIDRGWAWKKIRRKPRFHYYEGYGFIKAAIDEYNARNSGLKVSVESTYYPEYYSSL